jgi:hypothetical protein
MLIVSGICYNVGKVSNTGPEEKDSLEFLCYLLSEARRVTSFIYVSRLLVRGMRKSPG